MRILKEFLRNRVDSQSPRIDVWGFGLVLQEMITLEHAFGRQEGQPADEIRIVENMKFGKRTNFFQIFGETDEFGEFEILIQKCLHPTRELRPNNMMIVKNVEIFSDFVQRIERGELPSDIMATSGEMIEKLRDENRQKDQQIQVLENIVKNQIREFDRLKKELDSECETEEFGPNRMKTELHWKNEELQSLHRRIHEQDREISRLSRAEEDLHRNIKELMTKHEDIVLQKMQAEEQLQDYAQRNEADQKIIEELRKNGRFGSIEDAPFENDRGVTKAVDKESGATVMIKWITAKGPKYIKAAEEEAQKLRDLSAQSRFFVKFIDFLPKMRPDWWEWSILSFIVMEFCPGGSLKDWIDARKPQGRRTTVKEATVIGTQIALALSFCHSRKIAHLDVKPANVMMMSDGFTIKLGDFGISTLLDSVRDTITTKGLQGIVEHTLLYITPGNF
ncbi:Oidioi.mRNA.OKI2018_I69.PAR.g10014.t1.cds [Oikopleura dioica]|uniref:Oidioi.mRNA.OKI2018_I69.PAR.g10014.t1.cds n=1 Tax=Oikopleura dioica TaxID=34765 RepID=A0ABN7RRH8_OIKDI|nr:Oidioi.mRNA.OKI2018_I69.PAR.g10014.t1.cds [Oikopleura dioica]